MHVNDQRPDGCCRRGCHPAHARLTPCCLAPALIRWIHSARMSRFLFRRSRYAYCSAFSTLLRARLMQLFARPLKPCIQRPWASACPEASPWSLSSKCCMSNNSKSRHWPHLCQLQDLVLVHRHGDRPRALHVWNYERITVAQRVSRGLGAVTVGVFPPRSQSSLRRRGACTSRRQGTTSGELNPLMSGKGVHAECLRHQNRTLWSVAVSRALWQRLGFLVALAGTPAAGCSILGCSERQVR